MIRDIVIFPDDRLTTPCKPIQFFDKSLTSLVEDLYATLYANDGLGLAAPQIGVLQNVFVVDVRKGRNPHNPITFINPELLSETGSVEGEEGCLSLPGIYFDVYRARSLRFAAYTLDGDRFTASLRGMEARVFLHELDHLFGRLFIERATVAALAASRK